MASNPATIELYRLLVTLAHFWKENEKFISLEECRNVLPDPERLALSRLTRTLRGSRQRPSKNNKGDSNQDASSDKADSPEEEADLSEESDVSESDVSEEADSSEEEVNPSGGEADVCEKANCGSVWNSRRRLPQVSAVEIPYSLQATLESCKKEKGPRPFFAALSQALPIDGGLVAAYCKLRRCEAKKDILKIHRRFDLRNFYVLAVKYGYYSQKGWRRGAREVLAQEIKAQYPSSGSVEEIGKSLRLYVELGRGYDAWVTEFGLSGCLVALPLEISETEYTNRGFRKHIPEESRRLRALGLDKVVKTWKLDRLGEDISKELEERFRPPRAYISNEKKRKAGEYENRSKQRRYLPPPPQKNQNTRSPPIPVGSNSQQSFEKSRRSPTSAADPTQKLAEPAAPEEAATTSNLPRTPGIGFADRHGNLEKQQIAEDNENLQANGIECFSQPLNMTQFHQPGASSGDTASAASEMARLGTCQPVLRGSDQPQAAPDFNRMNIDSYNNQAPQPAADPTAASSELTSELFFHPAAFASFIGQSSQPAAHFESTSEQFFHPVAFASFIGTDPAIQSSQPAADPAALAAHFGFIGTDPAIQSSQPAADPAADPAALTAHFESTSEQFFHPAAFAHFIDTSSITTPMQPPQLREDLVRT
ncbi:hypothetical protein ACJ73_00422 [Blastomyces percursus]|uniref:Uncharacterized protein n=1 Tax=Blastomyces percursus TaxID=1658174 RepID=A0A1J9QI77_9EURO|nr:hypothetical protein ACJ73_00422 [Blastomyces percursus]